MKFFMSDPHFFHENSIANSDRPFTSVEEMNEAIVERTNATVSNKDELYILGDVSFGNHEQTYKILRKMHGCKTLILGNHDKLIKKSTQIKTEIFGNRVFEQHVIKIDCPELANHLHLNHYAMLSWYSSHYGTGHLHGHHHGSLRSKPNGSRMLDVGVDCNNFTPFSEVEVINFLTSIPFQKTPRKVKDATIESAD